MTYTTIIKGESRWHRAWLVVLCASAVSACAAEKAPGGDEPCADGSFLSPSGACRSWTDCVAGSRVTDDPSATADRACTGCVSGTFSTEVNATACAAWTDCPAGTYVTNTPSATEDRQCSSCPPRTHADIANLSACVPDDACAPGTALQSDACIGCAPGSYCAGGDAAAVLCASETWDHDGNPATLCAAHTTCVAGELVTSAGTATTDRACASCPPTEFSSAPNSASCTPRLVCQDGTVAENTPSSSACIPCASGDWDDDGDAQTACIAWTTCTAPDDYMTSAPSETLDRGCAPCADVIINSNTFSTYALADNAEACCTYRDPASDEVVVNESLGPAGGAETVQFANCGASVDGCVLTNALFASEPQTMQIHAATEALCTADYTYAWQFRYPTTVGGGGVYVARGVAGTTTDTVTIAPNSIPDAGNAPWRVRLSLTNVTTGVTLERRFRFTYLDSETSVQRVTQCQGANPPSDCPEAILPP